MKGRVGQLLLNSLSFKQASFQRNLFFPIGLGLQLQKFGVLAFADIPLHRDPVGEPTTLICDRHDAQLNPKSSAVFSGIYQLDFDGFPLRKRCTDQIQRVTTGFFTMQNPRRHAYDFNQAESGSGKERRIAVNDSRPRGINRLGFGDEDRILGIHDH